jgi:hypothetical protein|tara:strand:- start:63 stop:293 length:231 start_codon:yes stop_codon:yes gene_type:complete
MAAAKVTAKEIVQRLRDSGYSDGQIAYEMQRFLPGGSIPSLNSIRRWRYGKAEPSNTYAVVLEMLYLDVSSRGLLE